MMPNTKAQALCSFFSSFGIPAYEENAVPTGKNLPAYPYLTYEVRTDAFNGGAVALACNLFYREGSWTNCNAKAESISRAIGMGGTLLPCAGGAIWVKRGSSFAQDLSDPGDDMIKRKYITLSAEFLTAD